MADTPIEARDESGKLIASTEANHSPITTEELFEQRIREGHIRFADQADVGSVERFIEHLERSAGSEGVHIDAEDCASFARDLRAAVGARLEPTVLGHLEWNLDNRDYWGRCCVDAEDLKAVLWFAKTRGWMPL